MREQDLDWEFVRNYNRKIPDSVSECWQVQFHFRRVSNPEDCKYVAFKIWRDEPRDWYTTSIKNALLDTFPSGAVEEAMREFLKAELK